jgi:hypothetical protein
VIVIVQKGQTYRHYKKGDRYIVLDVVKNSETLEDMIVYRAEYGDRQVWVRPSSMWEDEISEEKRTEFGQSIRFRLDYKTWYELEDISF